MFAIRAQLPQGARNDTGKQKAARLLFRAANPTYRYKKPLIAPTMRVRFYAAIRRDTEEKRQTPDPPLNRFRQNHHRGPRKTCHSKRVPERIIKIDADIWQLEQKLKDVLAIEKQEALRAQLAELKKQREAIIAELEKKANERIQ